MVSVPIESKYYNHTSAKGFCLGELLVGILIETKLVLVVTSP